MRHVPYKLILVSLVATLVLAIAAGGPQAASRRPEPPAFGDFSDRVNQYLQLRKALPKQHTTKRRKEIVDRRTALAQAIREARPDAKQGNIFSAETSAQFLAVIRRTLQGTKAANVRKTIRQGDPVAGVRVSVNRPYPEDLPTTTVPPTLLKRLPQLPERLAYRIVGHEFVLQDTEARLVIDFIPGALP
ncbi:MAG: hypothetical protein ABI823_07260 [Bryobacteraceae bacterium]